MPNLMHMHSHPRCETKLFLIDDQLGSSAHWAEPYIEDLGVMLTAAAEANDAHHPAGSIDHTLRNVMQGPHALGLDCWGRVGCCRLHTVQRRA